MQRFKDCWFDVMRTALARRRFSVKDPQRYKRVRECYTEYEHVLEGLEPRVLLSSNIVPLDNEVGNFPAVIQPVPTSTFSSTTGSTFTADSRAVWASSPETFRMLSNVGGDRKLFLDFMVQKKVTHVYLFIGNQEPDKHLEIRSLDYAELISELHDRGLKVFALIGGKGSDTEIDPGGSVEQLFQTVVDYNKESDHPLKRFDGVNLDVEPWRDPSWRDDTNRLKAYADLGKRLIAERNANAPGLVVGAATPHWFGTPSDELPGAPILEGRQLHKHILDVYDYVSVLSFRDTRSFLREFVREEVEYGDTIGKPVVVGVEVTPILPDPPDPDNPNGKPAPDELTFYEEGEFVMENVLESVKVDYTASASFAGFAIQDLGNYRQWATDSIVFIIDDTDKQPDRFTASKGWSGPFPGQGFRNDVHFSAKNDGVAPLEEATWKFTDLLPGRYRVSTTWSEHDNRAKDAPYMILDDTIQLGPQININQELVPNADVVVNGVNFQDLGDFDIISGTLVVKLTNEADQFVIADAVRIERIGNLVQLIDDGDPGFDLKGSGWSDPFLGQGFRNDVHFNAKNDGVAPLEEAIWKFTDLLPGRYRVSTTWSEHDNRAKDAPYMILDDTMQLGSQININQELVPNADVVVNGVKFQDLGDFDIISGTLVVKLTNEADQFVIADAVRIERIGNLVQLIDDGDPGFSLQEKEEWTGTDGQGFEADVHFSASGTGQDVARWTFTDLLPGQYRVSVTWSAHANRATNAPFSIFDDTKKLTTKTINVNQEVELDSISGDVEVDGVWFKNLINVPPDHSSGPLNPHFNITSGILKVGLNDKADQYVIADAVRIERIGDIGT